MKIEYCLIESPNAVIRTISGEYVAELAAWDFNLLSKLIKGSLTEGCYFDNETNSVIRTSSGEYIAELFAWDSVLLPALLNKCLINKPYNSAIDSHYEISGFGMVVLKYKNIPSWAVNDSKLLIKHVPI